MLQPSPAATQRLGLAIAEGDFGLAARRIDVGQRFGLDALGLHVDQKQRDIGLAPARAGARGNDGDIGDGAVRHRLLHAVQGAAGRRELDRLGRRIALAFEQRQRADRAARCQQGKPFLLLRLIAGHQDGFRRQIDRRRKRHRRQRAAHLLGDHAEFEMPGPRAAEFLGDRDTEKAHAGEALPELAIVRLLAVEHFAHRLGRAVLGEILSRFVAELFLFVGEIEIHDGVPLSISLLHQRVRCQLRALSPCGRGQHRR